MPSESSLSSEAFLIWIARVQEKVKRKVSQSSLSSEAFLIGSDSYDPEGSHLSQSSLSSEAFLITSSFASEGYLFLMVSILS